jgi:rRNA-processing protein FCF1
MQSVIFDSSFLMAVVDTPTTWYEDIVDGIGRFEPVLPGCVREELEGLASGQGKKSRTARVALELASKFSGAPCGKASVDSEIQSLALISGGYVATTDSELLASLRAAHARAITLRSGRVAVL